MSKARGIYVLFNRKDCVMKVGRGNIDDRFEAANGTFTNPENGFDDILAKIVDNPSKAEYALHTMLDKFRLKSTREFFDLNDETEKHVKYLFEMLPGEIYVPIKETKRIEQEAKIKAQKEEKQQKLEEEAKIKAQKEEKQQKLEEGKQQKLYLFNEKFKEHFIAGGECYSKEVNAIFKDIDDFKSILKNNGYEYESQKRKKGKKGFYIGFSLKP